jgi:hypothetical protein
VATGMEFVEVIFPFANKRFCSSPRSERRGGQENGILALKWEASSKINRKQYFVHQPFQPFSVNRILTQNIFNPDQVKRQGQCLVADLFYFFPRFLANSSSFRMTWMFLLVALISSSAAISLFCPISNKIAFMISRSHRS